MAKLIIALVVMFVFIYAASFFMMYLDVKKYCEREDYDFKLYWHDLLRGRVPENEYELELRYKKRK